MYLATYREMADHSRHPLYRAIQQSIEGITQTVVYNNVKYKLLSKELITMEDLDEYDKLTNREAVLRMVRQVMRSITGCEEFLTILQEMPQRQYNELSTVIMDKKEQNSRSTTAVSHTVQPTTGSLQEPLDSQNPAEQADDPTQTIQNGRDLIEHLLRAGVPDEMRSLAEAMQLKKCVGRCFTGVMIYIIKLLQKAIKNNTVTLKSSVKDRTLNSLQRKFHIFSVAQDAFSSIEDNPVALNHSVEITVIEALEVKIIVKGLQKVEWLSWRRSAKVISALVPIFEKLNEVVSGIREIECRPFFELLASISDLDASLNNIQKIFNGIKICGTITTIVGAIGSGVCLIVGAILTLTGVASPVGIPLMKVGGSVLAVSATGLATIKIGGYIVNKKCLPKAITEGRRRGQEYTNEDQSDVVEQSSS